MCSTYIIWPCILLSNMQGNTIKVGTKHRRYVAYCVGQKSRQLSQLPFTISSVAAYNFFEAHINFLKFIRLADLNPKDLTDIKSINLMNRSCLKRFSHWKNQIKNLNSSDSKMGRFFSMRNFDFQELKCQLNRRTWLDEKVNSQDNQLCQL